MSVYTMSITRFREALSLAVNNTLNYPEMVERVTPFGYSQEELEAIQAQIEAFSDAKAYKHARYGFQKAATAALNAARAQFHKDVYMPHVTIARVAFKNEPWIQSKLGVQGARHRVFDRWINQARQFYKNALENEDVKTALAARGVTEADLTTARDLAEAIGDKQHNRATQRGLAQQSTSDRNDLRADLAGWLADYYKLARVAFADKPEWLERIGLLHRST